MGIIIQKANSSHEEEIWNIIKEVIASGDTYVFPASSSRKEMLDYWCAHDKHTFVALIDEKVVGTFLIKDNLPGLGAHIANASFMTKPGQEGKGIGSMMGEFCLAEAKKLGYYAMQFNIVVKTNTGAVKLWQKLGFEIIGEIPDAFKHSKHGLTNAYIMWRKL